MTACGILRLKELQISFIEESGMATQPKARWSIDAPAALDEAVSKKAAELGYSRTRFVLKAVIWALQAMPFIPETTVDG